MIPLPAPDTAVIRDEDIPGIIARAALRAEETRRTREQQPEQPWVALLPSPAAIEHCEQLAAQFPAHHRMACVNCGNEFVSTGPTHRMCARCRREA